MPDDYLMSYFKKNIPDMYTKRQCDLIIKNVKDKTLPDITEYKEDIKNILNIDKKIVFEENNYGLALKFYKLRQVFIKLFSKNEKPEFKEIIDWLDNFNFYLFEIIQVYKQKKFFSTDRNLNVATDYLRFYIEYFCNKYDFIFNEGDLLFDDL